MYYNLITQTMEPFTNYIYIYAIFIAMFQLSFSIILAVFIIQPNLTLPLFVQCEATEMDLDDRAIGAL